MNQDQDQVLQTLLDSYVQDMQALCKLMFSYFYLGQNTTPDKNALPFLRRFFPSTIRDHIQHTITHVSGFAVSIMEANSLTLEEKAQRIVNHIDIFEQHNKNEIPPSKVPLMLAHALDVITSHQSEFKPEELEQFMEFRDVTAKMLEAIAHSNETIEQITQALILRVAPSPPSDLEP